MDGIILLHDNAHPHVAEHVKATLKKICWEALKRPPYSTDISPCKFHIFGALKQTFMAIDLLQTKRCMPVYNHSTISNHTYFSMKALTILSHNGINVLNAR